MKRSFYLFFLLFACNIDLNAQFNLGGQFAVPLSGFGEHINGGAGFIGQMEFPIVKRLSAILQFDYIYWSYRRTLDNPPEIPLSTAAAQLGLRVYASRKFYLQGIVGGIGLHAKTKVYGREIIGRDVVNGWAIGAGVAVGSGDIGLRLQTMDKLQFLGIQIAYRFGASKKKW